MLPHTSVLLKLVRMAVGWPLYLVGFLREADTVFVPCFDFYEVGRMQMRACVRACVRCSLPGQYFLVPLGEIKGCLLAQRGVR